MLPQKLPYELMLTQWAQQLNPLIANPMLSGRMITGIELPAAVAVAIPTGLNRVQQGWFVTDNNVNTLVWRTQPFNENTLYLESTLATTISIWVF